MRDVLWRLSRPTLGLALAAAVCLLLALGLLRLVDSAILPAGVITGFASILSGGALLLMVVALIEFLLAAKAIAAWSAGKGRRCTGCDWPMSPSLVLPDRCVNPEHDAAVTR